MKRTKIDCCNGCTERQADPNCHGFCKKYLEQKAELDETNAERRKQYDIANGVSGQRLDSLYRATKKRNYYSKSKKRR